MGKTTKIILTIIITVIFLLILSAIGNSGAETGSILGWISVILIAAFVGSLVALWRKPKDNNQIQK